MQSTGNVLLQWQHSFSLFFCPLILSFCHDTVDLVLRYNLLRLRSDVLQTSVVIPVLVYTEVSSSLLRVFLIAMWMNMLPIVAPKRRKTILQY